MKFINLKKNKNHKISFFLICNITIFYFFSIFSVMAENSMITETDIISNTQQEYENQEIEIQKKLNEIDELVSAKMYDKASLIFQQMHKDYSSLPDSNYIKQQIQLLNIKEKKFYEEWAEYLKTLAGSAYQNKEWDKSIKYAEESLKILDNSSSSKSKEQSNLKIISSANREASNEKFREETKLSNISPESKTNEYKIHVYLERAETFIKNKQYEQARWNLEKILVIDPYNSKAMFYLRKVYKELFEAAKERTDNDIRERMAQVKWNYNQPISAKIRKDEQLIKAQIKEPEISELQQKLNNLTISKIDFDEATLSSVITYINRESKILDTEDSLGINLVLRLDQTSEGDLQRITMAMDDIPIGEAIKYICLATGLKYKVEEHAVIIGNESIDNFVSKEYKIKSDIINSLVSNLTTAEDGGFEVDIESFISNSDELENRTISPTSAMIQAYFTIRGIPFPEGSSVAWNEETSTLLVRNTQSNQVLMEDLLREIDIEVPLVLIETKFVEITEKDLEELGFDWKVDYARLAGDVTDFAINHYTNSGGGTDVGNDSLLNFLDGSALLNDFKYNYGDSGSNPTQTGSVQFWIYALDQSGLAEVLSSPKVITKSGKTALLRMVKEHYYPESWTEPEVETTASSGVVASYLNITYSTPEFGEPTDIGIRLLVTPVVSPNNYTVYLNLSPQVVDFVGWNTNYEYSIYQITNSGTTEEPDYKAEALVSAPEKMPIISHRDIKNKVLVADGSTIVLGGMIADKTTSVDDRYPIIGDLPLIGRLFRNQSKDSVKTNLLIFVTTHLINPDGTPYRDKMKNGTYNYYR